MPHCLKATKIPVNYDLSICSSLQLLHRPMAVSPSSLSLPLLGLVLLTKSNERHLHKLTFPISVSLETHMF